MSKIKKAYYRDQRGWCREWSGLLVGLFNKLAVDWFGKAESLAMKLPKGWGQRFGAAVWELTGSRLALTYKEYPLQWRHSALLSEKSQ